MLHHCQEKLQRMWENLEISQFPMYGDQLKLKDWHGRDIFSHLPMLRAGTQEHPLGKWRTRCWNTLRIGNNLWRLKQGTNSRYFDLTMEENTSTVPSRSFALSLALSCKLLLQTHLPKMELPRDWIGLYWNMWGLCYSPGTWPKYYGWRPWAMLIISEIDLLHEHLEKKWHHIRSPSRRSQMCLDSRSLGWDIG